MALIVCVPTLSEVMEKVACAAPFSVTFAASTVLPSLNVTVPEGVPGAADVTVAVKITTCPATEALGAEATINPVEAGLIGSP